MKPQKMEIDNSISIAVVIPCYKVEQQIGKVVTELPDWISSVILVNDASPDNTGEILTKLASTSSKIIVIHHEKKSRCRGSNDNRIFRSNQTKS
jgi:Glycosyltransferases involved in cell wall biogenesis